MSNIKKIDLSICPLTACNMVCDFCYIDKGIFKPTSLLDKDQLYNVLNGYKIRNLDVYGGEITLLDAKYINNVINIIRSFYPGKISFVSNGLNVPEHWIQIFKQDYNTVAFSVGNGRQHFKTVENNILNLYLNHNIHYSIICLDFGNIPFGSDIFKFADSVSIKPYSRPSFSANSYPADMLNILKYIYNNRKDILNKLELVQSDRDDIPHYFLMPDGKLYDVKYNNNGEYFKEITDEKDIISIKCLSCKYYKKCFNEHYAGYQPDNDQCIGRLDAIKFLDEVHNLH